MSVVNRRILVARSCKLAKQRPIPDPPISPTHSALPLFLLAVVLGGGRVFAENVLGVGAPSSPVTVNLGAFLGHLRAHGGGDKINSAQNTPRECPELEHPLPSMPQVCGSSPSGRGGPLAVTGPATAVGDGDGAPSAAGADEKALPSSKFAFRTSGSELDQQLQQRPRTSSDGIGEEATAPAEGDPQVVTPHVDPTRGDQSPSASSPVAYGGDFMGLGGFGEARVHNLFAPSSSSRRCPRRRLRAPPAGEVLRDQHLHCGGGGSSGNGPYPLPPIVLATGVSGENHGSTVSMSHKRGLHEEMQLEGGGGGRRGVIARAEEDQIDGSGPTTTNDVFHAFINLGRRLPGRLRRSPDR